MYPRMLELCRQRIGESEHISFHVGNARERSAYYDHAFDLIMFSFNGIDSVSHEDRMRILSEVQKLLKPDRYFFFSAHSLHRFPIRWARPATSWRQPLQAAARLSRHLPLRMRLRKASRQTNQQLLEERGWATLRDGAHNFDLELYYIYPREQLRQRKELGSEIIEMLDHHRQVVELYNCEDAPWTHYLCTVLG